MTIKVNSNGASALQDAVCEAEILASKPTLTKSEDRKYSFLLSKISLLKSGFSAKEIAGVEYERLCKETGVISLNMRTMPERDELEWRQFLSHGGQRHFNRPVRFEISEISEEEQRQQLAGSQSITESTGASGGFFVPYGFQNRTLEALRAYDEIFDDANCSPVGTLTGAPLACPATDDVENSSILVGENSNAGNPGATFTASSTQLGAYSFRSQFVFVSLELLVDTSFNVGSILERSFAIRHARGVGAYMINGTGVNQPKGLVTAAIATGNVVVAAGDSLNTGFADTGANSIGTEDLNAVYGGLNRAYRRESVWIMNDATLLALRSSLDKVGRPLVRFSSNDLASIYGRPVAVAPSMAEIGPSAISVALYAPRFFLQRRVTAGSYIRRTIEAPGCAEKGTVAFSSMFRCDSNLSVPNATYPPISLLQQQS
jgi:HK97 family phage major capsid protein